MIPARLVRTVPQHTTAKVEQFWSHACDLHITWQHVTLRDPIDPALFPVTAPYWARCVSGAQLAGLIRLEDLLNHGGIYIDSDIQLFRSLEPLRRHSMFAAWEDDQTIPDAVLGAEPQHPAIHDCLELAMERMRPGNQSNTDWRTGPREWSTGPGVTTTVLADRDDVALLQPSAFFGVHYTEKHLLEKFDPADHPEAFGLHHWHGSWLAST